jgi:hypothetical protein
MKSKNPGLITVGVGIIILMIIIWKYLIDPPFNLFPFLILSMIFIITGVFQIVEYYNKTIYFGVVAALLVAMWIDGLIQPIYPGANQTDTILYYLTLGIFTIVSAGYAYNIINTWEKNKKNKTS